MAEKKKWDDEEEGMKPWEQGYKAPKKPKRRRLSRARRSTTPSDTTDEASETVEDLTARNKALKGLYGEGPAKAKDQAEGLSDKKKKKR